VSGNSNAIIHASALSSITDWGPSLMLTALLLKHSVSIVFYLCYVYRRLPMIMPNELLGVPACNFMGQGQQHTAPPAEGDGSPAPAVRLRPPLTGDLWPQEPDLSPRGFDAEQIKQLYRQLSYHCQLLIQTYALTACNSSHQDTAAQLSDLLNDYQVCPQTTNIGTAHCSKLSRYQSGVIRHCLCIVCHCAWCNVCMECCCFAAAWCH